MNNSLKLLFILSLVSMSSCRSSKEMMYLKDAADNAAINELPLQTTEHILKLGDILYVSIKTINVEVNALFNPESNMGSNSGGQQYDTPSSIYLYGFEIDPEGNIKLPMLGKLKVDGVTVFKAEAIVQKKADEFINDAIVNVKLLNFKYTVMGEVNNPGVYYNYNNSINAIESLAMAGGSTDFASIKKVVIVRQTTDGRKSFLLDLSSKDIFLSEAFYLQPNDIVIVQPNKHKNSQRNNQIYSMILYPISLIMTVLGFVLKF